MIDNFDQISKLLTFNSDDEFYFVQILQRKKDNPGGVHGANNSSRLIKAYYITSVKQLMDLKEEMIFFANHFNARVGINLNKRSFYKTAFNTLKHIAEQMHNKNFKDVRRAYNTACGIHNSVEDKVWIIDVDTKDDSRFYIAEQIRRCDPNPGESKVITYIESKNGWHIITKPFNIVQFDKDYKVEGLDAIHKNNPTNLFIP